MSDATVFVVDDDAAVRDGLAALLEGAGLAVETYASAEAFLAALRPDRYGCLLLDVKMPGMSGTELQAELARCGVQLPIIFLTAHGDIPTSVQAVKAGAVDFFTKPPDGAMLIERVRAAVGRVAHLQECLAGLTTREREVMARAATGQSNKTIAQALGISHRTVEVHRARVMHKLGARSVLELADIARTLNMIPTWPPATIER
jgi:FixJ family two-component response regulator